MKESRFPGLVRSFSLMLEAAGDQARVLKLSLVCFALAALCEGLALACFFPMIDAVLTPGSNPWPFVWALGGFMIPEGILRWTGNGIFGFSHHYARVGHGLRLRLGVKLRQMPMERLMEQRTGELSATLSGNVDEVTTPMGTLAGLVLRSLVVPLVVTVACLFYNKVMALAICLLFPLAVPLYRYRRKRMHTTMKMLAQAHARTAGEILEYTQGLAVLRSANATGAKAMKLSKALDHLEASQAQNHNRSALATLFFSGFVETCALVITAMGTWLVLGNAMTLGALAALLVLTTRFAEPLAMFVDMTSAFDHMDAGLSRIKALFSIPELAQGTPRACPKGFEIRFKDVDFYYKGSDEPALKGVTCTFPQKSFTALVGPSGSGKTTLIRMIMRHADPQKGGVSLGGANLCQMAPQDVLDNISVVFQDVFLFDDTILNNIRMGRPGAGDEQVMEAAQKAGCHGFIQRLPRGYQTRVGEIGGRLSGGEKQRISIARALLKDTPIVILDEPTAALDTQSEVAVQRAVDALVRDRTVIVIAHRLSTIAGADQILVFDKGCLVQQGTHQDLACCNGLYHRMCRARQASKFWHTKTHVGRPMAVKKYKELK